MKWQKAKQSGCVPCPRANHTTTTVKDKLILFGGEQGRLQENEVHVLDTGNMRWEWPKTKRRPSPRSHHSACVYNTFLIIFGGICAGRQLGDLHVLNTEKYEWKELNYKRGPTPRSRHSAVIWKHYMVVFGGEQERYFRLKDMFLLDLENQKWIEMKSQNSITARCSHAAECDGDRMWVFGGETDHGLTNTVYCFNFAHKTWSRIQTGYNNSPSARMSHRTVLFSSNSIMLYGGFNGIKEISDIWVFHTETQKWKLVKPRQSTPPERSSYSMCCISDSIIVFGGCKGTTFYHDVWSAHLSGLLSSFQQDIAEAFDSTLQSQKFSSRKFQFIF
eukprot:gb/GECH01001047.1/.p1 GENE.gb/GECH01001047.1/~~gb/GECH01001047.1/.p1  ORF type:complete len:332 (+),score=67.50 gb/GECH01001047.1/:1-996(+)